MKAVLCVAVCLAAAGRAAQAQSRTPGGMPPPPGMSLAASAAMRFPQPVRVGDLLHREVLQPVESQTRIGRVVGVMQDGKGMVFAVIQIGGFFGFGSRPIAVPIDAMVLLGQDMEVVAYTPDQLSGLPTFAPGKGDSMIDPNRVIKVGLAKPSH